MATTPTLSAARPPGRRTGSSLPEVQFTLIEAPLLLRLWHLASLDAPTVAVVWCLAFAHARPSSSMPAFHWWLPTILGLSAWSFYIADRLFDARRKVTVITDPCSLMPVLQPRHHFHWRHRRILIPVALVAAVIASALVILLMPSAAQLRNSAVAVSALAYLAAIHLPVRTRIKAAKELLVAIIFTGACCLPVIAFANAVSLAFIPAMLVFTGLAWLNCHAIDVWESSAKEDSFENARAESKSQVVVQLPIARLALLFSALTILLAGAFLALGERRLGGLIASAGASAILLGVLDRKRTRLTPTTLRTAADLVLLTPAALLIMGT